MGPEHHHHGPDEEARAGGGESNMEGREGEVGEEGELLGEELEEEEAGLAIG